MKPANIAIAALLLVAPLAGPAASWACGYHDPASINLGALNMAYPDSLHVRTAEWMAQRDGELPPREARPEESDPRTATLVAMMRLSRTVAMLGTLRDRLAPPNAGRPAPAFSMILIGPMLWARFAPAGAGLALEAHAAGPASEDVVVVTDEPVVAALLEGRITPREARRLGLVRFYGTRGSEAGIASLFDHAAPFEAQRVSQHNSSTEAN